MLCILVVLTGCKDKLPDPKPDVQVFYNTQIKNVNSELVRNRLSVAKLGESLADYPELEDLFYDFIQAYLNAFTFSILDEETVIDENTLTARLIAEVSCINPQKLFDELEGLREEKYKEIMATGVMPSEEYLQQYFYESGIELMKNDKAERIQDGYQHITMYYDEDTGKWSCINGETMIENILP